MNVVDFSFQDHAKDFDDHISRSIPGYDELVRTCVRLSRRFVQPGTTVVDVGCSTGHLLASIQESNKAARPDVNYVGIDCVPDFSVHWGRLESENIHFEVCDARSYQGFKNLSLAYSQFTIQFIRSLDKMPLLRRIYDGLVVGGALIIAEKTLADTARLQDALAFPYYDYKLEQGFSEKDLLDKERSLRGR
jgi:tRNA (cmo5U34)-methyltransferase